MRSTYVALGLLLTVVALAAPSLALVEAADQALALGQGVANNGAGQANAAVALGATIAQNAAATGESVLAIELAAVDGLCGFPSPTHTHVVELLDEVLLTAQAYADWAQAAPDCLVSA